MMAIWKTGEGNIKAILKHINPEVPYTTFASTIKNLEKKEYLTFRMVGNSYLYRPIVKEIAYKKKFLNTVVKEHFGNSYKNLVNFFVQQKTITPQELKEIITLIELGNKS